MATAVIVDAVRTAGGKRNGKLSGWHPADLAAEVLKALVERNDLDPALVDDVIMGCVMQVGNQGLNIGRNAVLAAGFPESVPATTVDRQCGSSQQAAHFAAQGVIAGAYDIVVAAGVEVMTTTPMGASMTPGSIPFGHKVLARYADPGLVPQGISAEMIADKWGLSREDLDAFGAESQQRAERATDEGRFDNEIVGVTEKRLDKETGNIVESDELVTTRRGHPPRHHRRDARQPQAGLQARRQGHRRQLVADHRRRLRRAHHERGEGQGARPHPAGPLPHLRPRRRRPGDDAHRPDPVHREGARQGRHDHRRHRPLRGQRGLRLGRAGVGEGAQGRPGQDQRQRRRHRPRPPARRAPAPSSWPRCSTSSSAPAAATASRPCARAAAWPTPPSSSAWASHRRSPSASSSSSAAPFGAPLGVEVAEPPLTRRGVASTAAASCSAGPPCPDLRRDGSVSRTAWCSCCFVVSRGC